MDDFDERRIQIISMAMGIKEQPKDIKYASSKMKCGDLSQLA